MSSPSLEWTGVCSLISYDFISLGSSMLCTTGGALAIGLNPFLGMGFGALYAPLEIVAEIALTALVGLEIFKEHKTAVLLSCKGLAILAASGLSIALLALFSIPLTPLTLGIIIASIIVSAIVSTLLKMVFAKPLVHPKGDDDKIKMLDPQPIQGLGELFISCQAEKQADPKNFPLLDFRWTC